MVNFFCRRCQRPNQRPVCDGCGKPIPANSVCNVWEEVRLAIADTVKVAFIFRVMVFAVLLLFLIMLALEFIFNVSGVQALSVFMLRSGILPILLRVFAGGVLLGLLLLMLQGRETVQYLMDPKGILKRTWITPTRIKCWSRFIARDKDAIRLNADNVPFLLAHEEYLLYTDAVRYVPHPRTGRVALYRPYAFLFMNLHIPRSDYDEAAAMLAAKLRKKATR